jgi:hypothetical protein
MSPGATAPPVVGGDRSAVTHAPESAVDGRPADARGLKRFRPPRMRLIFQLRSRTPKTRSARCASKKAQRRHQRIGLGRGPDPRQSPRGLHQWDALARTRPLPPGQRRSLRLPRVRAGESTVGRHPPVAHLPGACRLIRPQQRFQRPASTSACPGNLMSRRLQHYWPLTADFQVSGHERFGRIAGRASVA